MKKRTKIAVLTILILLIIIAAFVALTVYQSPIVQVTFVSAKDGQHLISGIKDVEYKFNVTIFGTKVTPDKLFNNRTKVTEELQPLQQKYNLSTTVEVNRTNLVDHYFTNKINYVIYNMSDNRFLFNVWSNQTLAERQVSELTGEIQKALTVVINSKY